MKMLIRLPLHTGSSITSTCVAALFLGAFTCATIADHRGTSSSEVFPKKPTVILVNQFRRCEGIAFNGEGDLYVTGDQTLWRIALDGTYTKVAEMFTNLGLAPIGKRDLLVADFGPTNAFNGGHGHDGIVWRITPEGDKTVAAKDMGDPNFVAVFKDGSFLVSDDATDEIWLATEGASPTLFTNSVKHPNGLAFSDDGTELYVAQMFKQINPVVSDNQVWALPLKANKVAGAPRLLASLGPRLSAPNTSTRKQ